MKNYIDQCCYYTVENILPKQFALKKGQPQTTLYLTQKKTNGL